jgi:IstB-like ATP binding protein
LKRLNAKTNFQVITDRYERGSIIITTNIAFKDWPRIFAGDATMSSALLDRLLHHAQPVLIEGDSYAVNRLVIEAFRRAAKLWNVVRELHHSDRGVQYASSDFRQSVGKRRLQDQINRNRRRAF